MELPADRKEIVRHFGEGDACVVVVLRGEAAAVEAAKHAALSAVEQLKVKRMPEPAPCRGCGKD